MDNKIEFVEALKQRSKIYALRIIKLFKGLPKTGEARILGKQVLRSATSVAANYRAACRARSQAEFFSKISIVIEEADESIFWLELLMESKIIDEVKCQEMIAEMTEMLKIFSKARKTLSSSKP